jgi:hypothetical protein
MASRMGSSLGVIDIRTKDMESNEIKTWSNTNICRCMLQRERTISQHALMLQCCGMPVCNVCTRARVHDRGRIAADTWWFGRNK